MLTALNRIQVKQMRSVKPFVLAAYLNFTVLAMSLAGNLIESQLAGMTIREMWSRLPLVTYFLISLISLMMILDVVIRCYAVRNLSVSRFSIFMQMGLLV
jgi:hypothetical protein